MSEYYMLDCWGTESDEPTQEPLDADLDGYDENDEIEWLIGQKIAVMLPQSIEMEWDPDLTGGGLAWKMFGKPSSGPRNKNGVRRQWAYTANDPPLFHRDIITALRECGVDNFDAYETRIVDAETGEACTDYLAVNVLGLLKAVDIDKSTAVQHSEDGLIDTDFDSVAIDLSATHGFKLFRLAESVNALVIHKSVKSYLEAKGGFELTFTKPEDWIG